MHQNDKELILILVTLFTIMVSIFANYTPISF